jgi:hypothetical protein
MTVCFGISVFCIPCSVTRCLLGPFLQQGNKMAQVYATSFGWVRVHPMKHKEDAYETLSLVFQCDGVPPTMVTDDSKEQTKGEFNQKLKEADCHPRVTEPYSPWQQAMN